MSRIAFACLASALAASSAGAAEVVACKGPEIVTARFEEQICSRGVSGYAECHWVSREHDVEVGERCTPKVTGERAHLSPRGEFPPYPRLGGRD